MDDWTSDLKTSLSLVFPQEDYIQRVTDVIKNLRVCSAEDLKYVEADDLFSSPEAYRGQESYGLHKM